ncbi:polyprenyl synthetase family protein [Kribbella sp. NBC_00359]|uniref:polyprenyl synthetase family protein n=1 Tax=Kribbella sp. NBC_00359 TaxID=2975966 RepID=UPI002E20400F
MSEYLAGGEPAEYLYDLIRDYPSRRGKGIRPALALATCQAYGGSLREAIGPAIALELLHNAFLIHDDIEDESLSRRGAAALHELHGVGLAINAGDALASLAFRPLRGPALSDRLAARMLDEFSSTVQLTTEGQAMDLGWQRNNVVDLGPAEYLAMAARKTCWYTAVLPLRIGAIIGSQGTASLSALSRFGFFLGAAFQIRDDILNISGFEHRRKEHFEDIREGKRTLMLLHVLREANDIERAWLTVFLEKPERQRSRADVKRVLELMKTCGSLDFADGYAASMAAAADHLFDEAFNEVPDSAHKDFLRGLASYFIARRV